MRKLINIFTRKGKFRVTLDSLRNNDIETKCGIFLGKIIGGNSKKFRLLVSPIVFQVIDIVCDGEALEINTDRLSNKKYRMKRKLRGFEPTIIEDVTELYIEEFSSTRSFISWAENLPNDQLEACRQIYFERWNLDTGHKKDGIYYELLDEEYKQR